jgi:hypothetical protein
MDELKSIDEINKRYRTAFPLELEQEEFFKTAILNIFNENIIPETTCGILLTFISEYYGAIKNERLRIKYLLKSVESKNPSVYACSSLGKYYYKLKNYEETEKYFLMGVKLKSSICLDLLKNYYMENKMYVKILENCEIVNKCEFLIDNNIISEEVLNFLTREELKIYLINFETIKNYQLSSFGKIKIPDFFENNEKILEAYFEIFEMTPLFKHPLYKKLMKFEKVYENFTCPILLTEQIKGYKIKTCNHLFSFEIFKCDKCPYCRAVI